MSPEPIPIDQREADHAAALEKAEEAGSEWLDARAAGRTTKTQDQRLDDALTELRRASRRLAKRSRKIVPPSSM